MRGDVLWLAAEKEEKQRLQLAARCGPVREDGGELRLQGHAGQREAVGQEELAQGPKHRGGVRGHGNKAAALIQRFVMLSTELSKAATTDGALI